MKKTILLSVISLIIGLTVGFYSGIRYTHKMAFVYLSISNQSTKPIRLLTLNHAHGTSTLENIPINEKRYLKFYAGGETSYSLTAEFSDGTKVEGGGYAEGGYKITEIISDKIITSKLDNLNF